MRLRRCSAEQFSSMGRFHVLSRFHDWGCDCDVRHRLDKLVPLGFRSHGSDASIPV